VAAYYWWLFPNLMFNIYPWGLSINVVQPLGLARTRVLFRSFVADASLLGQGAGGALDPVEMEDEAVVLSVQREIGTSQLSSRISKTRIRITFGKSPLRRGNQYLRILVRIHDKWRRA
jgi:choline monooxygenase